jgi:uncharacterized damage-inducible protein DinB
MADSRGKDASARLRAAAGELLAEIDRQPSDLITWEPAAGVWSVMDILCHVQEFVPYWTAQTLRVIEHPNELWGRDHTDPDRLAAVANTAARRLADVKDDIERGVHASAATLERLTDADLDVEATSRNPRLGTKPAQFIVDHLLVAHVEKHIGQIRRNVTQYQERDAGRARPPGETRS